MQEPLITGPELVLAAYGMALLILSIFGLNRYILVTLFRKHRRREVGEPLQDSRAPRVTIQLPIYNEYYVAERLIRSACELDYPRHLLEVQVLDDSSDETLSLTRRLVRAYRKSGFDIVHLHRKERTGYKGGALESGFARARGEFVAIFDADFIIPRDFLRRTLPHFTAPDVGMVQTRWSYLNDDYSVLTRITALGLDGHFVVEQAARYWGGLFLNFNGTAGIWRASCIRDAGGWQHDTLTEDLDLSYRAQIAGWRFKYLWDVACPSEIPAEVNGLKAQQFRWTKGSMETARKILIPLWRARLPLWVKTQGTLHLLGNAVYPLFLVVGLLNLPLVLVSNAYDLRLLWPVSAYFLFTLFGTFSFHWTALRAVHPDWERRSAYFPLFLAASIGFGVHNTQAVVEGIVGRKTPFLRTPKFSLIGKRRSWRGKRYRSPGSWSAAGELVLGLYSLVTLWVAVQLEEYGALPFLFLFAFGYLMIAGYSIKHSAAFAGRGGYEPSMNGWGLGDATRHERIQAPAHWAGFVAAASAADRERALASGDRGRRAGRRSFEQVLMLAVVLLFTCESGDHAGGPDAKALAPGGTSHAQTSAKVGAQSRPRREPGVAAIAFPSERPAGFAEVGLVQKDPIRGIVTRDAGGAAGEFWYRPRGDVFDWFVQARGFTPDRAYRLLLNVDGATYAISSMRADSGGDLRGYGSLDVFAERICVSAPELDPTLPLSGVHEIRVWIQDDGASAISARKRDLPTASREGQELPCSGNGDGSYGFRLMEHSLVRFEGR